MFLIINPSMYRQGLSNTLLEVEDKQLALRHDLEEYSVNVCSCRRALRTSSQHMSQQPRFALQRQQLRAFIDAIGSVKKAAHVVFPVRASAFIAAHLMQRRSGRLGRLSSGGHRETSMF